MRAAVTQRKPETLRAARDESGFTLVELLVVLSTGLIVFSGLFAILDVTMSQSTKIYSRIDANQRARIAFETLERELHSGCFSTSVRPIRTGSTGSSLRFFSAPGTAASVIPVEHRITFDSSAGTLTDRTYSLGPAPDYTPGSVIATNVLLSNVAAAPSKPVFQYFAFADSAPYVDAYDRQFKFLFNGENPLPSGTKTGVGGTTVAPNTKPAARPLADGSVMDSAVEVLTTLRVGPTGGSLQRSTEASAFHTVSNSVVLRLTPIPTDSTSSAVQPCV